MKNISKVRDAINKIVEEANEQNADTIIQKQFSDAIVNVMLEYITSDDFRMTVSELALGVPHGMQHDAMVPSRIEDIEHHAGKIQKAVTLEVFQSPELYNVIVGLIREAM